MDELDDTMTMIDVLFEIGCEFMRMNSNLGSCSAKERPIHESRV